MKGKKGLKWQSSKNKSNPRRYTGKLGLQQ